ncbi:MAG: metal ABC transporter ATP-binding protein [Eubacterium sp.]|nr:metal ABC transporter ATP-binding protein [Eubacterium sp.]
MIFNFKNVGLGYENLVVAKDLNFCVNQGDYVCIVGENGAGKSTLIKTLLGLIKPLDGTIEKNIKKGIGYLPQQTAVQRDFPASVWEVVLSGTLSGSRKIPFHTKKDKELAISNMEKMHIMPLKKKCYRELSGGQQQRVLLARALCATDGVLILDEPTTGLDPAATMEFYEQIKSLNEKEGVTVIMVSHDIENVMDYATHILHLKQDATFYGTVDEYKTSNVSNMFLGDTVLHRIHQTDEKSSKDVAETIDRFVGTTK